jgi:HAD superfamily hydrolase (TIGR01549 family)
LIKALVFDLDGTLIQLPVDYEKLFLEFKKLIEVETFHPLADVLSQLDENTKEQVFRVWDNAELIALKKITSIKEGMNIYEKFSHKPKALVTLQGRTTAETVVEQLGLSFNVLVTREDSLDRVEQLKNARKKLKTQFESVLFVGNTENDFLAAEEVGCQFLRIKPLENAE